MAIDWNQYPTTGSYPNADDATFGNMANSGSGTSSTGDQYNWNYDPNQGIVFNPSQASPSSPMNPANSGTGGINPGGTASPVGTGNDAQAYYQSLFPVGSRVTPQDLLAHEADLKAHGITLIKNAEGQPGKISLADGSAYDVIQGAGTGNGISQWSQIAGPGGTPTGVNGSASGTLGSLGYSFGSSMAPFTGTFAAPTAAEAQATPGVQFGLDEANRMMQNSGAAHGTLLNGRFQQALAASNVGNALQDYNNIYNRSLNTFNTNRDVFYQNQDRPFNKNITLANLGKPA